MRLLIGYEEARYFIYRWTECENLDILSKISRFCLSITNLFDDQWSLTTKQNIARLLLIKLFSLKKKKETMFTQN